MEQPTSYPIPTAFPRPVNTQKEGQLLQYTGIAQHKSDDLIKWILSPQTRVEEFVRILGGYKKNDKGQWYVNDDEELIINEKGQSFLIGVLRGFMSPDVIMTRYDDEEQISKMILPLMDDIIIHLNFSKNDYGVRDSHIRIIAHEISNLMIATLRRGLKQGERDFLNLTTRLETKQIEQQQGKIPFIGGFLGKK